MDIIDPRNHTLIEGEGLSRERALANQPCPVLPYHFVRFIAALIVGIIVFGGLYAANAAQGVAV